MFVNFEVGALEKWIKLKGTEGPHVSHHDVFRPRAPAIAARPLAPTVSHHRRVHETVAALVSTAPTITPPHACAPTLILCSSEKRRPTRLPCFHRHRAPPLSLLTLLPCRRSSVHRTTVNCHRQVPASSPSRTPTPSVSLIVDRAAIHHEESQKRSRCRRVSPLQAPPRRQSCLAMKPPRRHLPELPTDSTLLLDMRASAIDQPSAPSLSFLFGRSALPWTAPVGESLSSPRLKIGFPITVVL
jgi:hypothetical protein